jgi:tetratricopeptide (TPR) repeat protein
MPEVERDLFLQVLDIESADQRTRFLDKACAGNPELRARVDALLQAHGAAGSFLEDAPDTPPQLETHSAGSTTVAAEGPGQLIGRYKLLEKIGEGGFGVVYMAEQREPVRRRVALKIIKLGMDTRQVVARFEAERQALALMEHPNIARVLDGGATGTGRPYFVMELVRGVPITQFCDEQRLDPAARLDLFIQVCGAIQHAHQKGIIHRDIKPSNVLVTLHDDRPVPKVIDFGIAKAMQGDLTDKTVFTRFHEFLGTPAYMSPEQTQLNGLDADTRSDIYALGVLLYELLTGHTPFDARELLTASIEEMRRRIREEEPLRPSTRLRGLAQPVAVTVAQNRRSQPARLVTSLRGDLDWIVLKCLEKDRSRRYDSASALARDITRHLRDEPVHAVAPSATYRVRKLISRHRGAFAAAGGFALLLLLATVVSGAFAVRATRAEQAARRETAIAEAVNRFLNEDLFNEGNLDSTPSGEVTLRTLLQRAALQIEPRLANQPHIEAAIRTTLGRAFFNLGDYSAAEDQWRRVRDMRLRTGGERHLDTLRAASDLTEVYLALNRTRDARDTAETNLAIARTELGPAHAVTLRLLSRLARICYHTAEAGRARDAAAEVVAIGRTQPGVNVQDMADALDILGRMIAREGDVADGERHVREALSLAHEQLGPSHRLTIRSQNRLAAFLYNVQIKLPEAERLYLDALAQQRRAYGDTHPMTLTIRANLGLLYAASNPHRLELALHQWLKVLEHAGVSTAHSNVLTHIRRAIARLSPADLELPAHVQFQPCRASLAQPASGWTRRHFDDSNWIALETADVPRQELWLRHSLHLGEPVIDSLFLVIQSPRDFRLFVNGVSIVPSAIARGTDGFHVIPFPPEAAATLRPGTNVIALHMRAHDDASEAEVAVTGLQLERAAASLQTSPRIRLLAIRNLH